MRKTLTAIATLLLAVSPAIAFAQLNVQQGGTGVNAIPTGAYVVGSSALHVTSTTSPTVGWITGTSTTASSTLPHLVVSAISIAGEYISNFTTYVRSLFSAGTGISISSGQITNTGVTSVAAGSGISLSGATGVVTITATGGGGTGGLGTTSPWTVGQLAMVSSNANVTGQSTSTPTIGSVLSYSGTLGNLIGGTSGTFSIANSAVTNAMIANSSVTVNGTTFNLGDSKTITAASSTLLANSNTFSGSNTFSSTITGSITGNAGTATALQNPRTINGTSFDGTANITITAASSTLLADKNTFTGRDTFTNATTTLLSAGTLWLTNITGSTQCLHVDTNGLVSGTGSDCGSGSGAVSSVSNSDGTLTISPTTGSVVASLALGHANTWSATQTFSNGLLSTASSTFASGLTTATTTTGTLNGVVALTGWPYAQTCAGLQQAINVSTGGVFIPSATITCASTSLTVPSDKYIYGMGTTSKIVLTGSSPISITGNNVTLSRLYVDASAITAGSDAIAVFNASHVTLDDIRGPEANGFFIFVHASNPNTTSDVTIQNSRLSGNGKNDVVGGGTDATGASTINVRISNSTIIQDNTVNAVDSNAVDLTGATALTVENSYLQGSAFAGNEQGPNSQVNYSGNTVTAPIGGSCAILAIAASTTMQTPNTNFTISGNTLNNAYISVFDSTTTYTNGIQGFSMTGNSVFASGCTFGVSLGNLFGGTVSGNYITGPQYGIDLNKTQGVNVSGNTIASTTVDAIIEVNGSKNNSIGPNVLFGNTANYSLGTSDVATFAESLDVVDANGNDEFVVSASTSKSYLVSGNKFGVATSSPFLSFTVAGDAYIGGNLTATGTLKLTPLANSILAVDGSGQVIATSSFGTNLLTGILSVAHGGTSASSQTTNGVNYYDGSKITSGSGLTFDGSILTVPGELSLAGGSGFQIQAFANYGEIQTFNSKPLLLNDQGNNVSVGSSTPGTLFSIGGTTGWNFIDNGTTTSAAKGINLIGGGCFALNGVCVGGSGGSGTVTSVTASTPNSTLTLGGTNPVTTSGTISFDLNLGNSNQWTASTTFTKVVNLQNASSTLLTAGTIWDTGVTSALDLSDSAGKLTAYTGSAPCTNQVALSISATGVITCTSVSNAMLTNKTIVLNGTTLTLGDSADTITAASSTLLTNNNTFSASTTFSQIVNLSNASSTLFTASTIWDTGVTSALHLADSAGKITAYGGTTCTNQFVRSLNGAGAATCNTVSLTADVTGTLALANGGTNASLSGANQLLFMNSGNTAVSNSTLLSYLSGQGALLLGTTTASNGLLTLGTSTKPQLQFSDNTPGDNNLFMRWIGNVFYVGTSTVSATSTSAGFTYDASQSGGSLSVGSSTPSFTAKNGLVTVGANGATGSTTISTGIIQWDGYSNTGSRICAFFVGTTLTAVAGACTQ